MSVTATPSAPIRSASSVPSLTDTETIDLLRIGQMVLDAVNSSENRRAAIGTTLKLIQRLTNAAAVVYFFREEDGHLRAGPRLQSKESTSDVPTLLSTLEEYAEKATDGRMTHVKTLDVERNLLAVTVPVFANAHQIEALSVVLLINQEPIEPFILILQLVAASIALWESPPEFSNGVSQARLHTSLLDLGNVLVGSGDLSHTAEKVADWMVSRLSCQKVAIGMVQSKHRRCQIEAISGTRRFDRRSEFARCLESVFEEALLKGKLDVWPAGDSESAGTVSQNRLCVLSNAKSVVSSPLHDAQGRVIGAWIFLNDSLFTEDPDALQLITATEASVGRTLALLKRAEPGVLTRAARRVGGHWGGLAGIVKLLAVVAMLAVLAIPLPYKVACNCLLQPVKRQYVAAPFDAQLDETLVIPGDLVSQDQVLARLDAREIQWELAGLKADYNRARKMRDTSLASGSVAKAQMATLEMKRMELRIRLLDNRAKHLQIKAPIDGLVITGDLEKTEGAPLAKGRILFEIAPLEEMVVELAIPDDDISHVKPGQHVSIRLDAHPTLTLEGTLAKIHPRAEQRDDENVFIGEVVMSNPGELLRPGMNGRAKIVTARHALGWNLFHRAYEYVVYRVGW